MVFKTATPLPMIDTNSLREAALRASWRRDQIVSRRRLAVRWVLWWIWKYRFYLLAACALVAGGIYLLYRLESAVDANLADRSAPVLADLKSAALPPTPEPGISLRMDTELQLPGTNPSNNSAPVDVVPDPYPLKPETQLKTKETFP
jgi:hypothetical protein